MSGSRSFLVGFGCFSKPKTLSVFFRDLKLIDAMPFRAQNGLVGLSVSTMGPLRTNSRRKCTGALGESNKSGTRSRIVLHFGTGLP